jgi:hypothetical protein
MSKETLSVVMRPGRDLASCQSPEWSGAEIHIEPHVVQVCLVAFWKSKIQREESLGHGWDQSKHKFGVKLLALLLRFRSLRCTSMMHAWWQDQRAWLSLPQGHAYARLPNLNFLPASASAHARRPHSDGSRALSECSSRGLCPQGVYK